MNLLFYLSEMKILITGGNGCLGRSLLRLLLNELVEDLEELRVLDCSDKGFAEYLKEFSDENQGKVKFIHGDVRNHSILPVALSGINCLFHTCAVMDVAMFPDESKMWDVNVRGTINLLDASYFANVEYFVFTSSVNSILADDLHGNLIEERCSRPSKWLYGGYGETKWVAERLVGDMNGKHLPNGKIFKTISLRPTVFYGEGDMINVTMVLEMARKCGGYIFGRLGGRNDFVQQTYVGNVAWAHLCGLKALLKKDEKCSGNAYFVTDNTPLMNPVDFCRPFLEDLDYTVGPLSLPVWPVYFLLLCWMSLLSYLRAQRWSKAIFWSLFHSKFSPPQIKILLMRLNFSRLKAEEELRYQPLFSFEEALNASRKYYRNFTEMSDVSVTK